MRPIKIGSLVLMLLGITCAHYLTVVEKGYFHEIYQKLYYIPIIIASFWYGFKGGVWTAIVCTILYLPYLVFQQGGNVWAMNLSKSLELILYNCIGIVTGLLSERQKKESRRYRKTADKLDESLLSLRKQTQELLEAEERLRALDRLATLGELSAGLAHEVRNPLGSIRGAAEIILDRFKPPDKAHELTRIIMKEVERLNNVVEGFLQSARPESPVFVDCDVNETIKFIASLAQYEIARFNIKLEMYLDDVIPHILADPEQMKQIFLNLVLNAVQSMPGGGALKISSRVYQEFIEIKFKDTGHGISREEKDKLFNPFFTTKDKGSGLGLAIVRRILKNHHGNIEVESEAGKGSIFTVTLPVKGKMT